MARRSSPRAVRIRCNQPTPQGICGRFLGEVDGQYIYIFCPACKQMHHVRIVDLVGHLEEYLHEIKEEAEKESGRRLVGFV